MQIASIRAVKVVTDVSSNAAALKPFSGHWPEGRVRLFRDGFGRRAACRDDLWVTIESSSRWSLFRSPNSLFGGDNFPATSRRETRKKPVALKAFRPQKTSSECENSRFP